MSSPEVGSAFVKLQLDPADFEDQITATAEAGAEKAQAVIDQSVEGQAQAILDLRTRSEAANLRALAAQARGQQTLAEAETLAAGLLNLQANIAQAQFAAEDALKSAASAMGAEREQFLAAAEAYKVAAEIGQDTLQRSREAGKVLEPKIPGQEGGAGGILGQLGGLLGGASAGRTGGLGGITALITRLGPLGLAAGAAFQAFNELQSKLRATGDEAFTTSGKIRNAAAELTSLNVIGAIDALTATRPAELSGGLQAGLDEIKQKTDDLFLSEDKLLAIREKSQEGLQIYLGVLAAQGHISDETAAQLDKVVNQLFRQREAAEAAETSLANYNEQLARAGSEAAQFGERGNEFGRGAEAINREREATIAAGGTFVAGTGGTEVGNQIRANIASRIADDQKRTQQELENAKIIQAQKKATFENVRETEAAAAAWKEYVFATTEVTKATQAAKQATQAAADAAQDAANTVRDAQAGRIRDEGQRLQAELANARILERQAAAAAKAAEGTQKAAAANAAYEQAITARVQLENQIKDRNEAAAEAALLEKQSTDAARLANAEARAALTTRTSDDIAAIKATRDYYLALAKTLKGSEAEAAKAAAISATARLEAAKGGGTELREQLLQNQLSAASLTSRLSDDRQAAQALVRFWESQVADAEGLAKARAQGNLNSAKARLDAVEQAKTQLDEQRIQNRINAARLTADPGDDKAAANALVRFWQKKFNEAEEGAEKVAAETKLIAAKLAAKGSQTGGDTGPSTIDFLGISQQISRDFAGNLLPTGSSSQLAGLFKLPGIAAGAGTGPEEEQVDELRRIRQLIEQRGGLGANVTVNQNTRAPDPTGFAQAHFARFAMEEAFNG